MISYLAPNPTIWAARLFIGKESTLEDITKSLKMSQGKANC